MSSSDKITEGYGAKRIIKYSQDTLLSFLVSICPKQQFVVKYIYVVSSDQSTKFINSAKGLVVRQVILLGDSNRSIIGDSVNPLFPVYNVQDASALCMMSDPIVSFECEVELSRKLTYSGVWKRK